MAEVMVDAYGRAEPPHAGGEVATLLGFLDYQRATLEWKCRGLSDEQLRAQLSGGEEAALSETHTVPEDAWEGQDRVSLRWVLVHMIEEYARHLGHADLIRESIDGQTGG